MKQYLILQLKTVLSIALAGLGLFTIGACGQFDSEHRAVRSTVERGAEYLVRQLRNDGSFVYRVSLSPEADLEPEYNLLRHAGSLYALGTYIVWSGDRSVVPTMESATRYMIDCCVSPLEGRDSVMALWSPPEVTLADGPLQAKLGGAGLALTGLAWLEKVAPESTDIEMLRGLGRFILLMQREDGSFFSKFIPSTGGPNDAWSSLFYPGEAALGLLFLHEIDPDPLWSGAAIDAIAYLARSRREAAEVPADHWALIATAKLFEEVPDWMSDETQELLYDHAAKVARSILGGKPGADGLNPLVASGNPTSTSTYLEGLLAIAPHLRPEDKSLTDAICDASKGAVRYLVAAQIKEGDQSGGLPMRAYVQDGELSRDGDIRIDYVQHALSALIQYDRVATAGICD